MNEPRNYDPAEGDLCQGDVILFRLPDGYSPSKTQPIQPRAGQLILAEGEATGHHHAIWFNPTQFRDDGLARAMGAKAEAAQTQGSAALYRDDAMVQKLVSSGHLTTAGLAIGFLTVEGAPVVLRHQEHDPIRIPAGDYYVGRQQEFHAGKMRRVAD
jgi:hypothetical protein